ncbi:hypothetical protein AKJ16_DCAP27164 [Drosera capensis]
MELAASLPPFKPRSPATPQTPQPVPATSLSSVKAVALRARLASLRRSNAVLAGLVDSSKRLWMGKNKEENDAKYMTRTQVPRRNTHDSTLVHF